MKRYGIAAPGRWPRGTGTLAGIAATAAARKPSAKQLEAIRLLWLGNTHREIGWKLGISEGSAQRRLSRAMRKMGARSDAHLLALVAREGWIQKLMTGHVEQPLTQKQLVIVQHYANGLRHREISRRVWIVPTRVTTSVSEMLRKTGARNRAHLVAICLCRDWIE